MAKLRVPSLQHLSRNWRPDPKMISRELVRVAKFPPFFNYNKLNSAIYDIVYLNIPVEQVVIGIKKSEKRETVCRNLCEVVYLIDQHFRDISPDFVNHVETRYYPVGKDLLIPFTPPLFYGLGGKIYFPWFSFWRSNPLSAKNLSLFVTIVSEILADDPDLEEAVFEIFDCSAPSPKKPRELRIINSTDVLLLSHDEKVRMLSHFSEGYQLALRELATDSAKSGYEQRTKSEDSPDDRQSDLFKQ